MTSGMLLPFFDPAQFLSEILIVGAGGIAIFFAYKYRVRIAQVLFDEDDPNVLHSDCLDVWWFVLRCCGNCNGEFTRKWTRNTCFPIRMRGINLVTWFGRKVGMEAYSVELKNIVVGDLPLPHYRRGNYYLQIQSAANPAITTSLAEDKLPKVIHFPEILTLKIRFSYFEQNVIISIMELGVLGHTEVCSVSISAMRIVDWGLGAYEKERTHRFQMTPSNVVTDPDTPPWLLVEFGEPAEPRDLENFHGSLDTVRTAQADGTYKDQSIAQFKREYALLDATGMIIQEPDEDDLAYIQHRKDCVFWTCRLFTHFVIFLIVAVLFGRTYVGTCYYQFESITIAYERHPDRSKWPMSFATFDKTRANCKIAIDGMGYAPGEHSCKPSQAQVTHVCQPEHPVWSHNTTLSRSQPRPCAYQRWARYTLGVKHFRVFPCFQGVCAIRGQFREYDQTVVFVALFLLFLAIFGRMWLNQVIYDREAALGRQRVNEMREAQTKARTARTR